MIKRIVRSDKMKTRCLSTRFRRFTFAVKQIVLNNRCLSHLYYEHIDYMIYIKSFKYLFMVSTHLKMQTTDLEISPSKSIRSLCNSFGFAYKG